MEFLPINDLPNELLELVFDNLDLDDLKNASLVCRRWSDLAFSGRRMERVMLVPDFPWDKDLLQSKRKYRHLELGDTEKCSGHVKELFQALNFSSLHIKDWDLSPSSLRLIFLEVPNLQHLAIHYEPGKLEKKNKPFPVMRKLERLEVSNGNWNSTLPWHTIAPSLLGLKMYCYCVDQFKQWRHFSGQLKHVYGTFQEEDFFTRFCQMTFPLLEELSMKSVRSYGTYEAFVERHSSLTRHEFFRRNATLRRLRLLGIYLSKALVTDITNHIKKLTYLEIIAINRKYERNGEAGSLESLAQLTELKHLSLEKLETGIFRGCKEVTSLQSLFLNDTKIGHEDTLGFLEDFFKIAPHLRCLELGSVLMPARAVHFICNKFIKLTHLQLTYSEDISRNCLSQIDQLAYLWYLELHLSQRGSLFIGIIPQNKVRHLTLHLPYKYGEDDFLQLAEIFPLLNRLNLINYCKFLHESTVDKLRQLLPTCAIIIYGPLITNVGMERCVRKWTRREMMPVWEKEWAWKNYDI